MYDLSALQYVSIVGVGRSGTTLLMSMLNAHPRIAFTPEFHFINQHLVKKCSASLNVAVERLQNDTHFQRLGIDIHNIIRLFTHGNESFTMERLYQEIMLQYANRQDVAIIGDKAPKFIEYLPVVHAIFPSAIIIHVIRDPRDVYLSRAKAKWSANRSNTSQFLAYRAQYALGRHQGLHLFGNNYVEVQYEKLLTHPQTELARICRLLQIPFDVKMMHFSKSAKSLVFEDELSWKKETLGPLLTDNMNKWRRELAPAQVARIESACRPTFLDGFYQLSKEKESLSGKILYYYMAIISTLYCWYIQFKNCKVLRCIRSK